MNNQTEEHVSYQMSMKEDLQRIELLRKLGDSIPRGYSEYVSHETESHFELQTTIGKAFVFGLLHKPPISVCDNFVVAGTEWNMHYHDEWELFVVYEGSLELRIHDENGNVEHTAELNSEDDRNRFYWMFPKTAHSIATKEHCSFIAITIPSSPDFPKSGIGGRACLKTVKM